MLANHYPLLLSVHGIIRWCVLFSACAALAVYAAGFSRRKPFAPAGRIASLIYICFLDTQVLTGIFLSFASPLAKAFWANPGAAMKIHDPRYFAVEHVVIMLLALTLAHVGSVRSRKASLSSREAYLSAFRWHAASLLVILTGIPWWRPLFRC